MSTPGWEVILLVVFIWVGIELVGAVYATFFITRSTGLLGKSARLGIWLVGVLGSCLGAMYLVRRLQRYRYRERCRQENAFLTRALRNQRQAQDSALERAANRDDTRSLGDFTTADDHE